MSNALKVFSQFLKDEDGAALIEYTVLLGILLIAVIATIGLVGTWVSKQWLALHKALSPKYTIVQLGRRYPPPQATSEWRITAACHAKSIPTLSQRRCA